MNLLRVFALVIGVLGFSHSPAFAQVFAVLMGANEVDTAGNANAGDPDGNGIAGMVSRDTDATLCYAILVTGIDAPTAAHIHEGAAGVNGPIVVTLRPPDADDPGESSECIPADMAVLTRILQNPAGFYVNVHNAAYPDGAIRGQLLGSNPASPTRSRSRL